MSIGSEPDVERKPADGGYRHFSTVGDRAFPVAAFPGAVEWNTQPQNVTSGLLDFSYH